MVAWNKFSVIWFMSVGLTPQQAGALKSLGQLCKLFAQPAWAALADMHVLAKCHRVFEHTHMHLLAVCKPPPSPLRKALPLPPAPPSLFLNPHPSPQTKNAVSLLLSMVMMEILHRTAGKASFTVVALVRTVWACLNSGNILVDAMVVQMAQRTREGYGKQRMWGSVAMGVMTARTISTPSDRHLRSEPR